MIPFEFVYCRPDTLKEAYDAFVALKKEGKNPVYYAGGSEIITLSRAGAIQPGAVIDIKRIPECMQLIKDNQGLHMGAACTLNTLKESKLFGLLRLCCGRIADHTNQCRITLGGNLCGSIRYRESSLPFLLSDASVTLFGAQGLRMVPFERVFDGRMRLNDGELVVQLHVPLWALSAPYFHIKRTANEKIDYPLITLAALRKEGALRFAFSGLCENPFRSGRMESVLNDVSQSFEKRAELAAKLLPEPPQSDRQGSGEYRLFVLENMLKAVLQEATHDSL